MCHHCVMESVKNRLLDRRSFFAGAAAAAATAIAATAKPARAADAPMMGKPASIWRRSRPSTCSRLNPMTRPQPCRTGGSSFTPGNWRNSASGPKGA